MNGQRPDPIFRVLRTSGSRRAVLKSAALALPALAVAGPSGAARALFPAARPGVSPAASDAPFDGHVEVGGGRTLYVEVSGAGSPTVVLDAGYGDGLEGWQLVRPLLASFTRVLAYDRASLGRSDPAPAPRTVADGVADLHAMLGNAGIRGPYVLVGHSYGGMLARLFASAYPGIAGLVLVDALHEDYLDRLAEIEPDQAEALRQALTTLPEGIDFDASSAQLRAAGPLPAVPTVVITRGRQNFPPFEPNEATERLWQDLQRDLASRVPGAELVVAERSGHDVTADQPELIAETIRRVVDAPRRTGA